MDSIMLKDTVMSMRTCTHCAVSKPIDEFHRDRTDVEGRSRRCKACAIANAKAWVAANPEKHRANNAAWKRRNKDAVRASDARYRTENAATVRASKQRYHNKNIEILRAKNRERIKAKRRINPEASRLACRTYYQKNLEKMRARVREYARSNPEQARARVYARRARKKNAPVRERVYRSVVWRRDEGRCHICSLPCNPARWDMDHVVPLARSGDHSYANIRVSHPSCNNRKRAKLMNELAEVSTHAG